MQFLQNLQLLDSATLQLQDGAVRDFATSRQIKDIDVLLFAEYPTTYKAQSFECQSSEPFAFLSDWFKKLPPGIKSVEHLGETHYPASAGDDFAVLRIVFDDQHFNELLTEAGIENHIDVILTHTRDFGDFVNTFFDFGICKIWYDRTGLHKTHHFILDNEYMLISMRTEQFSKEQIFRIMVRDHLARLRSKFPNYRPFMISENVINEILDVSSLTIDDKGLVITIKRN